MTLALVASTSFAKPPLREVREIDGTILAVGIADEIRKNCPTISARMFRAITVVNGLKSRARDLGYTDAEIDAYRKSDVEKERLKTERLAYFAAAGVEAGAPETYCALGAAEIAKGGQVGALLRMN
ncbi:MAG: DUF5333 domain-containing protein [Pseudomonadota bacterium]